MLTSPLPPNKTRLGTVFLLSCFVLAVALCLVLFSAPTLAKLDDDSARISEADTFDQLSESIDAEYVALSHQFNTLGEGGAKSTDDVPWWGWLLVGVGITILIGGLLGLCVACCKCIC